MRAISRDEVQFDPTARPGQPSLHQLGVVVGRCPQTGGAGIHRLDRPQQHDSADATVANGEEPRDRRVDQITASKKIAFRPAKELKEAI